MTNIQLTFWAAIGSFLIGTVLALLRNSPAPPPPHGARVHA